MKRVIVLIAGLLICSCLPEVLGQVNYQPGHVVSLQGDTLKGFIDYRNWEKNPKTISFRQNAEGGEKSFGPLDIRSFSVSGDRYESAIVKVETSSNRVGDMDDRPDLNIRIDTAFLQALVVDSNNRGLYLYNYGGDFQKQFYIRQGNEYELLIFKSYLLQNMNGTKGIKNNNMYLNQLALYMKDCPGIQSKMRKMSYNARSLKRLFDSYYSCTQAKPGYEIKHTKILETGVLAGGSQSSVDFSVKNVSMPSLTTPAFSSSLSFTGGLYFALVAPRNHGRWSLNNELVYSSYKVDGTYYRVYTSETRYDYIYTKLEYSYLKLNTMIRFKYPVGRFFVFANIGISNGYMLSGSDYQRNVRRYPSSSSEQVAEGVVFTNGVERYETGYIGGAGLRYEKYSIEARYEKSSGMVRYVGLGANVTKVSFLLTYRFSK